MKRGYYSFIILVSLYLLSFLNPLLINNKALVVKYNGEYFFPVSKYYPSTTFDQQGYGEAQYRKLDEQFENDNSGNWVIMPVYPFHPNESLLGEIDGEPPHAPTSLHWLGTDNRARDVFARMIYGFNISISFALIVTAIAYIIGITIGAILGFFGGRVDMFGQRFIEIFASIPFLYMVIIISSVLQPSFWLLVTIMSCFNWVGMTYYIRGEFYKEKAKDYVSAAISMGADNRRIMFKHILPNALTPIITFAPFALIGNISTLVSLDFLGFGLAAPTPSWGEIVNQGISDIRYWWLILSPMGASFTTLLLISFIGEGVREAFDPKVHSRLR
ncbi:MAG: ABC transporter permease subunit [Candidatus Marinimicrobia bacterium]|nr:ABC transporter permease subunit [Candidatus Neomarinimicrobiota bacterium]MBT7377489.1 ABC transporter permease subunit [Candidatus Neomarinimicrobiota bacterium]